MMRRFKSFDSVMRNNRRKSKEDAKYLVSLIEEGRYKDYEEFVEKTGKSSNCLIGLQLDRDALLFAIESKSKKAVEFFSDKCIQVPVLNEVHIFDDGNRLVPTDEDLDGWSLGKLQTPFISDDIEIMKILLSHDYDLSPKKVMWTDSKNLYYAEVTPLAAAIASGNQEMISLLEDKKESMKGFYGDYENWFMEQYRHVTRNFYEDVKKEQLDRNTRRLWSPEEAMILGSGNDITMLDRIFANPHWEGIGDLAIEFKGNIVYEKVQNHILPSALYYMDEEATLTMERQYPCMTVYYDIQKILDAANYVMLASYLDDCKNIHQDVIEGMIYKLVNPGTYPITISMLDEFASLSDAHVRPFDMTYYSNRRECCLMLLEAYQAGERGMVYLMEDLEPCQLAYDESNDDVDEDTDWDDEESLDEDEEDPWAVFKLNE